MRTEVGRDGGIEVGFKFDGIRMTASRFETQVFEYQHKDAAQYRATMHQSTYVVWPRLFVSLCSRYEEQTTLIL